jgi:hypothetical protein
MYFGYLLHPPPPLHELARPAEWGFVYMFITGQCKRRFIILQCYDSHLTLLQINEYIQHGVIFYVALAYLCHIVIYY